MSALIPLSRRNLTVWFLAFISPSAVFLLLVLANTFQVPSPPEFLVPALFILVPVGAVVICESVVWRSGMIGARRIGWMLFTLLALALQIGILLIIIIEAIAVAISYV